MDRDFDDILRQIRDSDGQKTLENRDVNARFKALGFGLLFGLLTLCATATYTSDLNGWVTFLFGAAALVALVAWDRANIRSIVLAKEQDRRYFLSCLRSARSIDELNRAGFFAYFPNPHGPEWVAHVRAEVARLSRALKIEPEWFELER